MPRHLPLSWLRGIVPALLLVLFFGGCDSGDPLDETGPEAVAGSYTFAAWTFQPTAPGVVQANVLSRLDASDTYLRLAAGGSFILNYRFENEAERILSGTFDVTTTTVRLRFRAEDADELGRLLLSQSVPLSRQGPTGGGRLEAAISQSVNLQAYAPTVYPGLTSVAGTLRLQLTPRLEN